jgi:hypothetical protein
MTIMKKGLVGIQCSVLIYIVLLVGWSRKRRYNRMWQTQWPAKKAGNAEGGLRPHAVFEERSDQKKSEATGRRPSIAFVR